MDSGAEAERIPMLAPTHADEPWRRDVTALLDHSWVRPGGRVQALERKRLAYEASDGGEQRPPSDRTVPGQADAARLAERLAP